MTVFWILAINTRIFSPSNFTFQTSNITSLFECVDSWRRQQESTPKMTRLLTSLIDWISDGIRSAVIKRHLNLRCQALCSITGPWVPVTTLRYAEMIQTIGKFPSYAFFILFGIQPSIF